MRLLKIFSVVLLCMTGLVHEGQSQTDNDTLIWAPKGATWHFNYRKKGPGPENFTSYQKYVSEGDTTINGHTATLLKSKHKGWSGDQLFYKNDGIVYLYDENTETFDTLYNFNSVPGNSWDIPGPAYECDSGSIAVTDTASITINGKNLKQLIVEYQFEGPDYLPSNPVDTITAQIGSHQHLLVYPGYCITQATDGPDIGPLRCYEDPILGKYSTNHKPTCDYDTSYSTKLQQDGKNNAPSVTLHPNPNNGHFHVKGVPGGEYHIRLFNMNGAEVYSTAKYFHKKSAQTIEIPKEKLGKSFGLYLIQFREKKEGSVPLNKKVLIAP